MTTVIFYEKPGCVNNTRQKWLLAAAGHEVIARNLLTEPWTAERLRAFFGDRPVSEWFNRAAPCVKLGKVVPEALDETTALALMLADPLLIRRPLIETGERRETGFDPAVIHAWIGLSPLGDTPNGLAGNQSADLESCPRRETQHSAHRRVNGD